MKEKKTRISEIGASSLMDYKYDKNKFLVTKYYNRTIPKHGDFKQPLNRFESVLSQDNIAKADAVLITIGNKGPRLKFVDHSQEELSNLIETNLFKVSYYLQECIKIAKSKYRERPLKIIIFNSPSGQPGNTYENHAMYAACKAALNTLIKTIKVEEPSVKFEIINLIIPYTQSKMTEFQGEDPSEIRKVIEDLASNTYNPNLSKYLG